MKHTALTAETALQQALDAAETICQTPAGQPCPPAAIRLLCELAASEDETVARAGVTGLFPALVERLNDSFAPAACDRYDEVFTQVIEFFRRLPAGRRLDDALRRFGLFDAADLLARKRRVSLPVSFDAAQPIKKILLLSRVTIGADVAVTSVLLAGLRQCFPQAEFVLLGSAKLCELFGGDARVRVRELSYERGGGVLARLHSWLAIVEAVADEARSCPADELLVIDPDSRLTQLGLLPVAADDRNYLFFESRRYRPETDWPLARLTAHWCSEVFGTSAQLYPQLALPHTYQAFGQAVAQRLRRAGNQHLVSLSFGVGGNQDKRIGDEFELELLQELLQDSALLLDKGGAPDERVQINRSVEALRAQGVAVLEINAENAAEVLAAEALSASVITWDGSIGAFAGLIAASDQYIGYDSAGQHIAAALGVPTLTIFVTANAPRFASRWQPFGSGRVVSLRITKQAAETTNQPNSVNEALEQILVSYRLMREE